MVEHYDCVCHPPLHSPKSDIQLPEKRKQAEDAFISFIWKEGIKLWVFFSQGPIPM